MFDFYQKRKLRTIVNSPYTQGILLVLVTIMAYSSYVRYDIAMEMSERRAAAAAATTKLDERKQLLQEQVEYLSSERGIEAEMRRQFDVALPGEEVVVIVEEESDAPEVLPLATTSKDAAVDAKWYQFWR